VFLLVGSGRAETIEACLVSFMVTMREIEPRNGQSCINELFELFHLPASGSERAHNFGAAVGLIRFMQNRL
jgi:hypothetical protein